MSPKSDTRTGVWPLEVREAFEALEERFGVAVVSIDHYAAWVERARRLEAALRKCVDVLDAKPVSGPGPIYATVSHFSPRDEALHAARVALGDLPGVSLLGDAGAPTDATSHNKPSIPQGESIAADELRALSEKATPGPWEAEDEGGKGSWLQGVTGEWAALSCGNTDERADDNAAFIVAAVNYVRAMLSPPTAGQDLSEGELALPESDAELEKLARHLWGARQEDCARFGANIPMPTLAVPVDRLALILSENARLRAQIADMQADHNETWGGKVAVSTEELTRLLDRSLDLEGVKVALRPFAAFADRTICPDDHPHFVVGLTGDFAISAGDFRRAHAALQSLDNDV